MLSKTSADISVNYFKPLVDSNIKLIPKRGSIVQDLTSSISSNIYTKVQDTTIIPFILTEASVGVYSKDINGSDDKTAYVSSTHDAKMDNYIQELSETVSKHISFIRGTVNKEVQEFVGKAQKGLDGYKFREITDFFKIKYYKLPEVLTGYTIRDELNGYRSDDPTKYFFSFINLDVIKSEEFNILEYLLTGYSEEDKYINNWFNSVGRSEVIRYLTEEISEFALGVDSFIDYTLANYLFYRKLSIQADLETSLPSVQLKSFASSNRDYFGKKAISAIMEYERLINIGALLTSDSDVNFSYYNDGDLHITVLEESFAKLAEEGKSIDLLLSYIANESNSDITVQKLLDNEETYVEKWQTIKSLYYSYLNSVKIDFYKEVFKSSLDEHRSDAEKEIITKDPSFDKETIDMQYDYINSLTLEDDLKDIEKIALHIIAKIRFRFTSAYYILSTMKSLLDENPEMDPLEASLYASVNYVTDYLMDQVNIVKV